jgi:hypothetical protein
MHILLVEALLIAVYLRRKDVYMYIRPTLLPEAALSPKATLPPAACPAEPSAISVPVMPQAVALSKLATTTIKG